MGSGDEAYGTMELHVEPEDRVSFKKVFGLK